MTSTVESRGPVTLVEMLARQASRNGERIAYAFEDDPRSFGGLWSDVEAFAAALVDHGVQPTDRVVMALPNGHDFFTAFYGSQRARAIAVPIFSGSSPARILEMADLCGARHVVVGRGTPGEALADPFADTGPVRVLSAADRGDGALVGLSAIEPDDVAFIQYTSGSTGDPKGVQLSHANLLTNVGQMIEGMDITSSDRFVSWLPVSHDMGLILMSMVPFMVAAPLFLLRTQLRDPRPWLDAITRHRATFTASPDFGYRLCIRATNRDGDDQSHDLSSLRVALNAAEPVRASTIDGFHEAFGLTDVMVAAYGLAEATVGVSMWKPSSTNRVDGRGSVSVGVPFPDVAVRILDDDDRAVPPGTPGHIVVTTPAATRGYFANPRDTDALLMDPDTIRTGDIGQLDDDGYLYVLSRSKDVIIQAGRTVYPQEVEEVANTIDGVRYAAAIGVDRGGIEGEQLVVLAEIRPDELGDDADRKACVVGIVGAVFGRFGFRPARVHLVGPKTLPMTYNGKLRRGVLRQQYVDRALDESILYPGRASAHV